MSTQHIHFPSEVWFFILKFAIRSEWSPEVYFPPPDDFNLITGFKQVCRSFRALAIGLKPMLYERCVCVPDAGKLLHGEGLLLDRVRHIMIERNMTVADYMLLMPRLMHVESLSLSFVQSGAPLLGLQAFLTSEKLVRLDLTYEDVWWRALPLDFPNLRELRLSSVKPSERRNKPTFIPFMLTSGGRFVTGLINSLRKLHRLKFLSLHISLDPESAFDYIEGNHLDRHKCASTTHFTKCKFCTWNFTSADIDVSRELTLSKMLAESLPALERALWTDAWNESFYEEEAQRESRIVRYPNKKIRVDIVEKLGSTFGTLLN